MRQPARQRRSLLLLLLLLGCLLLVPGWTLLPIHPPRLLMAWQAQHQPGVRAGQQVLLQHCRPALQPHSLQANAAQELQVTVRADARAVVGSLADAWLGSLLQAA